jgi:hypothetical protein
VLLWIKRRGLGCYLSVIRLLSQIALRKCAPADVASVCKAAPACLAPRFCAEIPGQLPRTVPANLSLSRIGNLKQTSVEAGPRFEPMPFTLRGFRYAELCGTAQ